MCDANDDRTVKGMEDIIGYLEEERRGAADRAARQRGAGDPGATHCKTMNIRRCSRHHKPRTQRGSHEL